jgi:hypothetical protein
MNWNFNNASDGVGAIFVLVALGSFAVTILWLFIGWRAMRAHERIARALEIFTHADEHDLDVQDLPPGAEEPPLPDSNRAE